METKRISKFEWLRILSMGMIVTLHYMFKGNILPEAGGEISLSGSALWLITAASICAVNVYVLISGYFLTVSEFKLGRVAKLIIQVLEYSLIITVIMLISGAVNLNELTLYSWLGLILPVGTEEYWFVTAYVFMYLFSPFLSAGAKAMDKKQLRCVILALLLFFTIEKTIIPMDLPTDGRGYEFGWFMLLYLTAAYIRLYGISFLEGHRDRALGMYILSVLFIWTAGTGLGAAGRMTGVESLTKYSEILWDYNSLPVFTAALGLFYIFKNADFNLAKENTKRASFARMIGPLTLGIYLLHEHPLIRYRWQNWLGVAPLSERSFAGVLLNWILCVFVICIAGAVIEFARQRIHKVFGNLK